MWLLSPKANAKLGKESKGLALGCFKVYFSLGPLLIFFWMLATCLLLTSLKLAFWGIYFPMSLSALSIAPCCQKTKAFVSNKPIDETSSALELFYVFPLISKQD